MDYQILKNENLDLSFHFWEGKKKKERIFLSSEIMKQLGYSGGLATLNIANLDEKIDFVKITKKDSPAFFDQLSSLNLIGRRSGSVIMLYESGIWKLIMQSKKQIGINTRNWLAREVLPSIRQNGSYDVSQSINNPFSYLYDFTEQKKQVKTSKDVAEKIDREKLSYSEIYNKIHLLVVNKSAKEIKQMFNSKDSARETLRKYMPEHACTESVIDELFTKYNKTIEEIKKSNAHKTLPPAFESLFKLGLRLE